MKIETSSTKILSAALVALTLTACGGDKASTQRGTTEILNVSYDVSRDFYNEYNPLFANYYKTKDPNANIVIKQSHGGSSKQALSIVNGLQADVATMNQGSDIEVLAKNNLVKPTWESDLPNHAVPFTSTIVFLVRDGNPKAIKDWDSLANQKLELVIANPKSTGNGRYAFLGAYGYGLHTFNKDTAKTDEFAKNLLNNVAIFESGGRAATTTFAQRDIGDVLITFENEAHTIVSKFADKKLQIVYPSYSISAENPVATVTSVTDKKGTTAIADEYLKYLWSDEAQNLAVKFNLRPSVPAIMEANKDKFPAMTTFRATDVFGSWDTIMTDYFKDGGIYDKLVAENGAAKSAK
ncbi:MAG: sulfate ABC transporter substrate-binding protein [Moraxella sp.]|uniref:sulfate ABC transporter substrate-binding protein n=1 Tax=Moraxella sp. TaxID=479 RepID=UPI0026DD3564|nr:sulfate ABC transporter substrate-binding protein [Moraxella sp.]MDO4450779.1 sulfate ABC transporter substrate-binding protein [Moraxella sp.]